MGKNRAAIVARRRQITVGCGKAWFGSLLKRAWSEVPTAALVEGGQAFQNAIQAWFEADGWQTEHEIPAPFYDAPNRRTRRGRADLAVWRPGFPPIFIECDRMNARYKSRKKLGGLGGGWVVCWANGNVEWIPRSRKATRQAMEGDR